MTAKREKIFAKHAFAATIVVCISTLAIAQENDEQTEEEVIEEIVVIGGEKPGDPVDVEALYEEMMRDMLMTDLDRLRVLEEDQKWRGSSDANATSSSRIKWGYDPQDDLRFKSKSTMPDVQWVTTKPATQFRFEF